MRRMTGFILAGLLIVMLSACEKQAGTEASQPEEMPGHDVGEEQTQEQEETVMAEDITFNFETKTVMLNSGYEMPIYGIGTYSLTGETCVDSVTAALNSGVRLIDTAYMYHNDVICCEL